MDEEGLVEPTSCRLVWAWV